MSEIENQKKKKSKFGVVLGVVVISLAMIFSILILNQKEKYEILDNSSREVASMISDIKDIRTMKGYKIIGKKGNNQLVLISAGLSYDPEGNIEVESVEFDKNKTTIVVKENINQNPEKEKVVYPFVIVKLSSEITDLIVVTDKGIEYEEIFLNKNTNEGIVEEDSQEVQEDEQDKEEGTEEEVEEEVESEEEQEDSEQKEEVKTLTCVYQGKADAVTIEISVGDTYRTFDITSVVNEFNSINIGQQITIEYIDTVGNGKIIAVR